MQWFALHTYSGFENKVQTTVDHLVTVEGYRDRFDQLFIPMENVVEIKKGKKEIRQKIMMPGYVLVHMEPDDDLFNLITKVPGVAGFVGDGTIPIPLNQAEVDQILNRQQAEEEKPKAEISYNVGEQVKVVDGPFVNFTGTVQEVDAEKQRLKVMVNILGRSTAVELDVLQVEGV
ncbi:transcription termination/antitermination factor NusG [Candidatus Sumerlaeota bacterium]|nr:transcription termination/antitermination factor NusG [Candidatus Sumerlaeota bacterium]